MADLDAMLQSLRAERRQLDRTIRALQARPANQRPAAVKQPAPRKRPARAR